MVAMWFPVKMVSEMITRRMFARQKDALFGYAGILTGLGGAMILFKDLIFSGTLDVLWADNFDSRLIYWIVNWGYHILFEQRQPLSFWDANSFYPNTMTLAYSDSLLGIQLLFAPLRISGFSSLTSLYLALAGLCVIGSVLTEYALRRIGYFSLSERLLITFSAHFGLSITSFLVHYQLFGFQVAPPFFLFLYLYLRDLKHRDLFVLVLLFGLGISIAMYLAPMLFVLCVPMGVPLVLRQIRCLGIRQLLKRIGIRSVVIVVAGMVVLYYMQVKPYLEIAQTFPRQSFEETALYSADLSSILTGFSKFSFWYGPAEYPVYGAWEYAFFPGFVLLTLSVLYGVVMFGGLVKRLFISLRQNSGFRMSNKDAFSIPGDFVIYMAILFLLAIILACGPYYKSDHSIRLPFFYLAEFIFGLSDVRAPGRFGMFVALPLAVFAVAFLRVSVIRRYHWAVRAVTILIVIESFPQFPIFPFSVDEEGIYKEVSQEIKPGTPLVELPVFGEDHFETLRIVMRQLNGSTIHWGKLMVGYGANKMTPHYKHLLYLDNLIQKDSADPIEVLDFGKQYGISHFLIHLSRYSPTVIQKWQKAIYERKGEVLFEINNTIFLRLDYRQD